jgi:hypothetical protein
MATIPNGLKKYFWEVDFKTLNPKKYWYYIIERILEYGDIKALRWLFRFYPDKNIKQTVKNTRLLSSRSINFWVNYFNLDKRRVSCLRKNYRKIWKH